MIRLGGSAAGGSITVGAVHLAAPRLLIEERYVAPARVAGEVGRFDAAVAAADAAMAEVAAEGESSSEAVDVIAAHRAILQSDEVVDAAHHLIRDRAIGAEWALRIVLDQLGVRFAQMRDERFRE